MNSKINLAWSENKNYRILVGILHTFLFVCMLAALSLKAEEQSDTLDRKELLASMDICMYPEIDELKDCKFQKDWLQVESLSREDVDTAFSNFCDLNWLKPIAQKNKVFLFGENHYYQTTHHLRNRILFALNTFDRYPLLIIEQQYSLSGFWNYYISLTDDNEAENFYQNVIYNLVGTEEMHELLGHLQRWNRRYPDRRIHIGATDVEHDYISTLRRVIIPYFQLLDPSFRVDLERITILDLKDLLQDLEKRLQKAKSQNLVGAYPFLTPQYIECVIENLRSFYLCRQYDFNYYRQHAMVRNLTDPRFFGKFLTEEKVMIHGGSYHTPTHFPYPEGGNFLREGSYLSFDFEPTKGKTYSVYIKGLAYQIGSMADINLDSCLHHGSSYRRTIKKFQRAYKEGLVSPESYYLFNWEIDDYDKLIFAKAYANGHLPLLVKKIKWNKTLEKSEEISRDFYETMRWIKDNYDRYDAFIIIPRSPITHVKRKRED
ncbi:hypothetical protein KAW48_02775 [candidate division WOR-3 bacterium]|nr:hypothetical protein [candidate division WOR-3 bacterium]